MPDPVPMNVLDDTRRRLERLERQQAGEPLQGDGGGGTSSGMEERVAKLETHFEYVRKDLDEIKADQKTIIAALGILPTKRDLTNNVVAIITVGLAVVAITIGGIIGGLAWLDRPARAPWADVPVVAPQTK